MTCGLGTTLVRMTPVASTVILATGVRLSYAATGADSGQPVVLLPRPLRTRGRSSRRSSGCPVPLGLAIVGAVDGPIGWPSALRV